MEDSGHRQRLTIVVVVIEGALGHKTYTQARPQQTLHRQVTTTRDGVTMKASLPVGRREWNERRRDNSVCCKTSPRLHEQCSIVVVHLTEGDKNSRAALTRPGCQDGTHQ